ncbi:MAG: hypothetical protein ACHQLQ_02260 [Candidatus Acidiferrales bacterium]
MTSTFLIGGARIDVTIDAGKLEVSQMELLRWVKSAAESVTAYYSRFPVPHLVLQIACFDGSGVRHGQTFGRDGGLITINVGNKTPPTELADDWMLTHEMVHLAFPSMGRNHHWIEEGLSTYVEPIARIRAGHWTARQMWMDLVRDLPKGLPKEGDAGLDNTHTWGRTYWGGALFCFVADVEIRRRTNNKKGLQDALRGILNAGGDIREDWELVKALKVGDEAAGVDVLLKQYEKMKDQPANVDLPARWKELGIESDAEDIHFREDAPLAAVRHSITDGESAVPHGAEAAARPLTIFAGRTAGR